MAGANQTDEIDLPRFRAEPSYRLMIMPRGVTLSPETEAECKRASEEFSRGWAEAQRADQAAQSGQVVKIDDPRFRVRRPAAFSAPRR